MSSGQSYVGGQGDIISDPVEEQFSLLRGSYPEWIQGGPISCLPISVFASCFIIEPLASPCRFRKLKKYHTRDPFTSLGSYPLLVHFSTGIQH